VVVALRRRLGIETGALGPRSRCGSLPSLYCYHQVDGRFVPKLKNRLIFR
jgi:hypothetical protein